MKKGCDLKICVVGAGASGICVSKYLLEAGFKPIILEKTSNLGGTWVYKEETGHDEFNSPIHSSMYKNLRTNLPRAVMNFPDFPFPENTASYPHAKHILEYVHDYSNKFGVTEHIKFNHSVKLVKKFQESWIVTYENLKTKIEVDDIFDYVFVCNGQFHTPNTPIIKGINSFQGDVMHSHHYRIPDEFKDKKVLIIGGGPSGIDISLDISKTAKKVILSHHSRVKINSKYPGDFEQKPDVQEIDGNRITFLDKTSEEIDFILYCTGYLYNYPFLDPSCGIDVEDNSVKPLYKHMVNIEHPTMFFIGVPFFVCAFPMFDIQARYCVKAIQGGFQLPNKEHMYEANRIEFEERAKRGLIKRKIHMMGPFLAKYYDSIADEASVTKIPQVLSKITMKAVQNILNDIVNARNIEFKIVNDDIFEEESV